MITARDLAARMARAMNMLLLKGPVGCDDLRSRSPRNRARLYTGALQNWKALWELRALPIRVDLLFQPAFFPLFPSWFQHILSAR